MKQHGQQPKLVIGRERKLIGKKLRMSLVNNQTSDLWRSFMPERMKIPNRVSNELISMRVYPAPLIIKKADQEFEKWATVEVSKFEEIPVGMERFILKDGLYAVFDYKGLNTDPRIFIYIFNEWLPSSNYKLDDRPHFEILGDKYKNGDPESEEEIWIPVILK